MWDSTGGISTGYGMDRRGSIAGKGNRYVPETGPSTMKDQGHEPDHSSPSSSEVKNSVGI
jgi:hypothetical protein